MAKETKQLKDIREAFANYVASEGCSCCRDQLEHGKAENKLAELLNVEKYSDGSGAGFFKYQTIYQSI